MSKLARAAGGAGGGNKAPLVFLEEGSRRAL